MAKAILVVGATGNQGGAVINNLLQSEASFPILAVTRDPVSSTAQSLAQKSSEIKLIQGDLDDPVSLFKNIKTIVSEPVWGVYFVQNPLTSNQTPEQEVKQATNFIDECINHKVRFFVYGSVDRGGDRSFNNRFQAKMFLTCWKIALKNKPLQLIAVSDIGYFAAQAFMAPERYKGQAISLAGDELTFDQASRIFQEKTGQGIPLTFGIVAWLVLFFLKGIGAMFKWMQDEGFGANVQELRSSHPHLVKFETYLETQSGYVSRKQG
ncbi:hypothetical protein ACKAV7_012099 [Fusarium commune]